MLIKQSMSFDHRRNSAAAAFKTEKTPAKMGIVDSFERRFERSIDDVLVNVRQVKQDHVDSLKKIKIKKKQ